jgi:hypothetical protein
MRSHVRLVPNAIVVVAILVAPALASAQQQRPLDTQDPETLGAGRGLLQIGAAVSRGDDYPLSGLRGNLSQLSLLGLTIGLGAMADLQITGGPYDYLQITEHNAAPLTRLLSVPGASSAHDVDDIVVATKIRWVSEASSWPSVGSRLSVRLPNSKHHSGLGQDTTDFSAALLVGKSVAAWRMVGNIGATIMTEPIDSTSQNDVLTYGVSLARRLLRDVEVVGEVNGRKSTRRGTAPPGTESRSVARAGARIGHGTMRLDVGAGVGLATIDPSFTATAGVTFLFKASASN